MNPFTGSVDVDDNVKPVLTSGSLTSDNKLALGFSEVLTTQPVANDLVVKVNGSTVAQTGTTALTVTPGTGSDAGKYLVNLDGLVIQGTNVPATTGTPAVMGNGVDGIPNTGDDVVVTPAVPAAAASTTPTYVDVNNNGAFNSGTDIKIGDGPVADFKFSTSPALLAV